MCFWNFSTGKRTNRPAALIVVQDEQIVGLYLPNRPHRILAYRLVRREQGQAVRDGLANQHAVEGVPMVLGQARKL